MRPTNLLRYGLWAAVAATAARNRKEYGFPTAWLTHLAGNTFTLLLPDLLRLVPVPSRPAPASDSSAQAFLRALDRRVREDQNYAAYVAPLALGFILSHPEYSIYHGRWAERTIYGFGADSVPHAWAAYALARVVSEGLVTLDEELPPQSPLVRPTAWAVEHVDALSALTVVVVTFVWELVEYLAHEAELASSGRDASEINMQWSVMDATTDTIANCLGLAAAIAVRRANAANAAVPPSHAQPA